MPLNAIPLPRLNPNLGALLWLTALVLSYLGVAAINNLSQLLLLAILLITPLALFVVYGSTMPSTPPARHLPQLYWPAALTAFASFLFPPGLPAALLVVPWFLYSGAIAFHGLQRLLRARDRRASLRIEEVVISFGFLYLIIGGFWLLPSRGNLPLAQFASPSSPSPPSISTTLASARWSLAAFPAGSASWQPPASSAARSLLPWASPFLWSLKRLPPLSWPSA